MYLDEAANAFRGLVDVIKALRTPGTGCPWDLEQTHKTLRPFLVEEAYEVLDAIDSGDDRAFREELGDLLLQVVLHAQLAADRNAFSITDVIRGIAEKMVRRHPHVFGGERVTGSAEVVRSWEQIKAAEAAARNNTSSQAAGLAHLPRDLPALLKAQRLGEKSAKVRLDAPDLATVVGQALDRFAKLAEAAQRVVSSEAARGAQPTTPASRSPDADRESMDHDLGDVLFNLSQLARWLGLSAEDSLRGCNKRYLDRFQRMEERAGRPLQEYTAEELDAEWKRAAGPPAIDLGLSKDAPS